MAFKETVTAVVVKNAIKYARKDFDKNAPRILSLMEMADVKKVNRSTYAGRTRCWMTRITTGCALPEIWFAIQMSMCSISWFSR